MTHKATKMAIVLAIAIFVGLIVFKAQFFSVDIESPKIKVSDSQVPSIETTFVDLKGDPIRGRVDGSIVTGPLFKGSLVYFCLIADGEIISEGERTYLTCPASKVKEAAVDSENKFSVSLFSGTYFMDIPDIRNKVHFRIPLKVTVHKGQSASIILSDRTK